MKDTSYLSCLDNSWRNMKVLWITVFTPADLLKHRMLNSLLLRGDAFHFKFLSCRFQLLIHGKPLAFALWLPPSSPVSCISHSLYISIFCSRLETPTFHRLRHADMVVSKCYQCVFSEAFCRHAFPPLTSGRGASRRCKNASVCFSWFFIRFQFIFRDNVRNLIFKSSSCIWLFAR